MSDPKKIRVAYLTVGYPTLSQTFIQREVEGLARNGIDIRVFPCRQFGFPHEVNNVEVFPLSPVFFLSALAGLLRLLFLKPISLFKGLSLLWKYKWNSFENFFATLWGIISGLAITGDIIDLDIQHIHAAWATLPATAAAISAQITGKTFSFGAHAYDVYRHDGDGFLREKLAAASFVHTTTQMNVDHLSKLAPDAKIILARRGLSTLPTMKPDWFTQETIHILSVGRLVKKKGYPHQLEALYELKKRDISAHLKIVGDGPLMDELKLKIHELHLKDEVELLGSLNPIEVLRMYRESDIFWFTGVIDPEGDRDGLPNVIPEAMSHGVAVISSHMPGAMEAIENEVTGLTIDIAAKNALADATIRLTQDKLLVQKLTHNAREWVEKNFVTEKNTAILAEAIRSTHP